MKNEKAKAKTPATAQDNKAEVKSLSFLRGELSEVAKLRDEFSKTQLDFVRGLVGKDLTESELLIFLSFSNKLQLNPLIGEIIAVVYNKDNPAKRRINYIITRNGKRVVATRTGELESITTEAIYVKEVDGFTRRVKSWEGGTLWGAECTVVRNGVSFTATVPLKEYNTGRDVWYSKPETMIKKVAESQALSAAFPEILGIAYDDSEKDSIEYKQLPTVEDDRPAQEAQLQTIKSLGGEVTENMTYNQAIAKIDELTQKGGKK